MDEKERSDSAMGVVNFLLALVALFFFWWSGSELFNFLNSNEVTRLCGSFAFFGVGLRLTILSTTK